MSLNEPDLKLHLGCGSRFIPGFEHVDLAKLSHVNYRRDARDLSCFGDDSVSLIYACHVLEYFGFREVHGILQEWRRVLKPSGVLRLAVPDFDALLKVYEASGALSAILGPLYGRMVVLGGSEGKVEYHLYHRAVYNFATLSTLLRSVGFCSIHRWDWRETEHSEIDDCSQAYWPHMDKENGILISLNVEARKAQ